MSVTIFNKEYDINLEQLSLHNKQLSNLSSALVLRKCFVVQIL